MSTIDTADKPLSPIERRFIAAYFRNGMRIGKAYEEVRPGTEQKTAQEMGSRMLAKIKTKTKEWTRILDLAGLDDFALASENKRLLRAKRVEFYKGSVVRDAEGKPMRFDDNNTQMRAVELLADLRGRRKVALPVGPDGELMTGVLLVPGQKSEADWEAGGGPPSGT